MNLKFLPGFRARAALAVLSLPLICAFFSPTAAAAIVSVSESGAAGSVQYVNGEADLGDSIFGGCSACITSASVLGNFDLNISAGFGTYMGPVAGNIETVTGLGGTFSIANGSGTLLSGSFDSLTIDAVPNSSSAIIQLNLNSASTTLLGTLPAAPLYLDISGTTLGAVTVNGGNKTFNSIALDWTADLNTAPEIQPVPLPAAAWLLASGLVGSCVMLRKRKADRLGAKAVR